MCVGAMGECLALARGAPAATPVPDPQASVLIMLQLYCHACSSCSTGLGSMSTCLVRQPAAAAAGNAHNRHTPLSHLNMCGTGMLMLLQQLEGCHACDSCEGEWPDVGLLRSATLPTVWCGVHAAMIQRCTAQPCTQARPYCLANEHAPHLMEMLVVGCCAGCGAALQGLWQPAAQRPHLPAAPHLQGKGGQA